MDNRANTDCIRDDIRTLGSAVARPCTLARNSLGASLDRRGVCRGTVAAGADGPRGVAQLPAVAARRRSARLLLMQTVFRFDLTVTTYTIDDASKSLLYPCRLAAPRACGIHAEQPGNITRQIDAALLRAGRRWCPRLADLTEWQDAAYALGDDKSRFAVRDLS
jgi:hypothetical protein